MNKTSFGSDNVADFSGVDDEWAKEESTYIKFKWQWEHSLPERSGKNDWNFMYITYSLGGYAWLYCMHHPQSRELWCTSKPPESSDAGRNLSLPGMCSVISTKGNHSYDSLACMPSVKWMQNPTHNKRSVHTLDVHRPLKVFSIYLPPLVGKQLGGWF